MKNRLLRAVVAATALGGAATWLLLSGAAARVSAQGEGRAPTERRNFLTCPVVRDTATLPCWLAEYDGETYYLGTQGSSGSAFYPPQLNHEVLVEGVVSSGPRVCGGIPLAPLRISVMPELNRACNTILPAEAAFTAPPSPLAPMPKYPDSTREFTIPYDFDSDYLTLHTTRHVVEAARIARLIKPARIEVRGRRGATLLSNGQVLTERAGLGQKRATTMGEHLVGLGIQADKVQVAWEDEAMRPGAADGPDSRRLTITPIP